jgi:hypothetical protein
MDPRRQLDAGPLFVMQKIGGLPRMALLAALWSIPLCEDEEWHSR